MKDEEIIELEFIDIDELDSETDDELIKDVFEEDFAEEPHRKYRRGDDAEDDNSKKNNIVVKVVKRTLISVATALLVAVVGIMGVILILDYGPSKTARNLFVNSAMESSAGKFLAQMFISKEKIEEIRNINSVAKTDDVTDTSLLTFTGEDAQVVNDERPDIEIIDIQGDTYRGKLMKIKDPSRVTVGISGNFGSEYKGKTVKEMADSAGAIAAVNGGGFEDIGGVGNGGTPIGVVISNGELKYGSMGATYEMIGFDNNNALVVGRMTPSKALERGVRDAISFGPILIVNGEASEVSGTGSGLNPRTAIGQCADGTVLLMTMDGRQVNSFGGSYQDIIDVMLANGAVNAANLDGGSSTLMYYNGEYINNCSSLYGARTMPTCFIVK
ncbi:MAG: phosphodiester glycosidase family protein [Eubacteriales bacterium]|nr:phosphodiester glycosidase family protein [Eubacteriales bacterium]